MNLFLSKLLPVIAEDFPNLFAHKQDWFLSSDVSFFAVKVVDVAE